MILENQNKELGSYIKQQGYYPLILKGNEKEFYKGEQRDLLLYLLKEELKNNHNQKQQQSFKIFLKNIIAFFVGIWYKIIIIVLLSYILNKMLYF